MESSEQGVDSTSLSRRIDNFSVIQRQSRPVQAEYWERMLWDRALCRSTVLDVFLD